MNILFVHEIDWLRKVVFEIHTLSELLSLRGHNVYAIDYESMWEKESLFDFGSLETSRVDNVARAYPGASVSLIRPGFVKISGLSRLTAGLTFSGVLEKTIAKSNIDVIILYSVPTSGLQTLRLAKKFEIPVVFRSIDVSHQLAPFPLLRPVVNILEKKVYSGADLILTISPKLSEYVVKMGTDSEKVELMALGVDTEVFHPGIESSELRKKWNIGEVDPLIMFIGTLYEFSGLDLFLEKFIEVLREIPEVRLMIVGDGPQRLGLEKIIAKNELNRKVVITGFQPYEDIPQYINMATVCINPFKITDTTRDIFPTKILQYLACGKAVVATPLPGMQALAPGEKEGILYAGSPSKMVPEVIKLLQSLDYRTSIGEAGLDYIEQKHRYDRIAQNLETILSELVTKKSQ